MITMGEESSSRIMTANNFPYRIKDIQLPNCNSGFVYMLGSIRLPHYTYIGTTINLRDRLNAHNSGYGSSSTEPLFLRPFALLAYISGFNGGRRDLRFWLENKWKERRDELINQGIVDPKELALCGNDIIQALTIQQFGVSPSDLTLVCLFR